MRLYDKCDCGSIILDKKGCTCPTCGEKYIKLYLKMKDFAIDKSTERKR